MQTQFLPDQFNFLVVPIGINVGLSLAHIAISLAHYVQHHVNVRIYWVPIVWAGLLFVFVIQGWYVLYTWRDFGKTFFQYLYFIVNPLLTYGAIVLLLPRSVREEPLDLKEHFFREHRWFFFVSAFVLVNQTLLETVIGGKPIFEQSDWPRIAAIALVITLAVSPNRRVHEVLAGIAAILLVAFILLNSRTFF